MTTTTNTTTTTTTAVSNYFRNCIESEKEERREERARELKFTCIRKISAYMQNELDELELNDNTEYNVAHNNATYFVSGAIWYHLGNLHLQDVVNVITHLQCPDGYDRTEYGTIFMKIVQKHKQNIIDIFNSETGNSLTL